MSMWLIVPRDPLIFRDGKPFTAIPGERSQSLTFPYPATLAGAVRTLTGPDAQTGLFDKKRVDELKQISVRGLALVELAEDGNIKDWLFPAPADALLVEDKDNKKFFRHALAPFKLDGAVTDLDGVNLIGSSKPIKNKPYSKAPQYWNWNTLQAWLEETSNGEVDPKKLGLSALAREYRTHVSIDPISQASREGALFQTSGMEFIRVDLNAKNRAEVSPLALAVETDADLKVGADYLGGERRVVRWQRTLTALPECPNSIKAKIVQQKHCRMILTTPACFENGYLPSHLLNGYGIKISVQAVAVSRYQTISGWDYEKRSPKPTRRLVPAGSVYFLELNGAPVEIEKFVEAVWFQSISDDEQSRRDGFGLALLGAWDGELQDMEVKS